MTRLSRAVAITAVTLALPLAAIACNKEQDKKTAAPEAKADDPNAAKPAPGAEPAVAGGEASPAQPPGAPPAAGEPPPAGAPPPGMPATPPAPVKKPDSVKPAHVASAEKIVVDANKFADSLADTKGDCKKATGVLKTGNAPLKNVMAETEKLQNELKGDQAAMQWFQQTYAPKMMSAVQKMGMVVQQCQADKEFAEAFQSLGMGGPPRGAPPPPAAPPAGAAPASPDKPSDDKK